MTVAPPSAGRPCPHCGTPARAGAKFCRACGKALQRRPPSIRRRLIVLGTAVLAAAVAFTVAVVVDRAGSPADRPVRALFAALAQRDLKAVQALVTCRYGPLCADGAFAEGYEPPTNARITDIVRGRGDRDVADPTQPESPSNATVFVRYDLGGRTYDDSVEVARRGWFRSWSILAPPGWALTFDNPREARLRIGGRTAGKDLKEAWALPGIWTVTVPDDPLYAADPIRVTAGGHRSTRDKTSVAPVLRFRDGLAGEIDRQVRARIDACAEQPALRPDINPKPGTPFDCPFSANDRYTITRNLQWRITRYPRLELVLADARALAVRSVGDGEAVISYEWSTDILEPRRWTPFSEPIAFSVGGTADTDDDGKVVWSP